MLELPQKKVTFDLEHDYKTLFMYKKIHKSYFHRKTVTNDFNRSFILFQCLVVTKSHSYINKPEAFSSRFVKCLWHLLFSLGITGLNTAVA